MNNFISSHANSISKIVLLVFFTLLFILPASAQANENSPANLEIKLTLKQQQGEYHPPYVAAWLESTERKPVRTLILWRKEPKWLKDIRRWWRNVGRKDAELVDAITSATHAAGTFPLSFKATDDQQQALLAGDYTLYIEVVREKGGRVLLKQTFTLDNKAQHFTLNETAETGNITFTVTP
tara:strand:+ start:145 stop:687 length:543 start_codon:yes stop_codon:yes gene_type:complete